MDVEIGTPLHDPVKCIKIQHDPSSVSPRSKIPLPHFSHSRSFPTFPYVHYEAARSAFNGLLAKRNTSADTFSFVLRIVILHSLASLFGSSRPRIPTFPAVDEWRTPAITS